MTKLKHILINLLLMIFPIIASASGIQASPSKMEFKAETGQTVAQELVVANPTADVQLFQVYPDEFANLISASPASFTLEAGARKSVKIGVHTSTSDAAKSLNTNISVTARPLLDAKFAANTGVKIPLAINILTGAPPKIIWRWPVFAIAIIFLAIGIYRFWYKKQKSCSPQS